MKMSFRRAWRVGLACAVVFLSLRGANAGVISEVFIDADGSGGLTDAVELSGLPADEVVTLVALNARAGSQWGVTQSAVSLNTGPSPRFAVLLAETLPDSPLFAGSGAILLDGSRDEVFSPSMGPGAPFDGGLDLRGSRLLVLVQGQVVNATRFAPFSATEIAGGTLGGLPILDTLAFSAETNGVGIDGSPLEPIAGPAIVVPITPELAFGEPVSGPIAADGTLVGITPPVAVTPGLGNPVIANPVPVPEPASAVVVAVAASWLLTRRRAC